MDHFRAAFVDELVKTGAARALFSRLTPESSNVRGFSYDPSSQALTVTYKSGGSYRYDDVPPAAARALGRNKSTGKAINRLIKAKGYAYEKVAKRFTPIGLLANEVFTRAMDRKLKGEPSKPAPKKRAPKKRAHQKQAAWKDQLHGGLADKKTPADFDPEALSKGIKVELEHVNDRDLAMEITMDHLTEDKAYYDKLEKIEKKAEDYTTKLTAAEIVKESFVGAIAAATRGMPVGTKGGRQPPKPTGHPVTKHASSIVSNLSHIRREMMKAAGVAKRQTSFDGLPIKVEHDPGDTRTGTSRDGKTWSRKMYASYGYVPGTKGMAADGDAIDIYLAAEPVPGSKVYEVSQNKKGGGFDEHKYMLGYESADAAKAEYLRHMPEWAFGSMSSQPMNSFRDKYARREMAKAAGILTKKQLLSLPSAPEMSRRDSDRRVEHLRAMGCDVRKIYHMGNLVVLKRCPDGGH
jgi:hypothetical protein